MPQALTLETQAADPMAVAAALRRMHQAVDQSDHDVVDALMAELASHNDVDPASEARIRASASHSLYRRNRVDDMATQAARALESARSSGDALALAEALVAWARVEWAAGQLEDALNFLGDASALSPTDARCRAHLNTLLGLVHADLGLTAESENFHRTALEVARNSGELDMQLIALTNLAGRLLARGKAAIAAAGAADAAVWAELDSTIAEADGLALSIDRQLALPHILVTQADSLLQRGRLQDALIVMARQRRTFELRRDRSTLPHAALVLAQLHQRLGDLPSARQALEEGIAEAQRQEAKAREAALRLEACTLEEAAGCYREALQHHKRYFALREAGALENAQRKAAIMSVRLQTARAQQEAAQERQRATELAASYDVLQLKAQIFERAAYVDALTRLANRRRLDEELPKLHASCRANGQPLAVAVLDADHFKLVNDQCSHAVGDQVLRALGRLISEGFRAVDLCARYGGEEFVIALPGTGLGHAFNACERLRERVAAENWKQLHPALHVTISIGLADITACPDVSSGLALADARLYAAKAGGRNRVVATDPAPPAGG